MSFAVTPKTKGDDEKVAQALRRLAEEDPTLQLRRDPQTGEQLLSGMSQVHVEVAVDRLEEPLRRRGRAAPAARPVRRDDQGRGARAGPLQEADRRPRPVRRLRDRDRADRRRTSATSSSTRSSAASSRRASGPRSTRGSRRRWRTASSPARRCRACASASSTARTTRVDSSEMAFKIAGSMAFKNAYEKATPIAARADHGGRGDRARREPSARVNGDLNSRRGRLQGMEPVGGMTTIKAEVPMAEMLTYSQSLTSLTGGRGDYHMHFLRYEEVPTHIAQKLIEAAKKEQRGRSGLTAGLAPEQGFPRAGAHSWRAPNRYPRAMRVTRSAPTASARSASARLLMGERTMRFSPNGGEDYVDVCPLCQEIAARVRLAEGGLADDADDPGRAPAAPLLAGRVPRRRERPPRRRSRASRSCAGSPSRSSAIVEAADLFNASQFRRTVGGIAKSLGAPRVSIIPLSGVNHGGRRHGRLGDLLVPVPRHARRRRSRCGSPSAGTSSPSSRARSPSGTRTSVEDGRIVPDIARVTLGH